MMQNASMMVKDLLNEFRVQQGSCHTHKPNVAVSERKPFIAEILITPVSNRIVKNV